MCSDICFLYYSRPIIGSRVIADSTSSARLVNQCLFLLCRLYLGPLFNNARSFAENVMSMLLRIPG